MAKQTSNKTSSMALTSKKEVHKKHIGKIPVFLASLIGIAFGFAISVDTYSLVDKTKPWGFFAILCLLTIWHDCLERSNILKRITLTWLILGGGMLLMISLTTYFQWWTIKVDVPDILVGYAYALLALTPFLFLSRSEKSLAKDEKKAQKRIMNSASKHSSPLAFLNSVSEHGSPLAFLSLEKLIAMPSKLLGQDKAQEAVLTAARAHDGKGGKPMSLLFCGGSGVGKTQLAENIAYATGLRLTQFNMGEIAGGTGQDNSPGTESRQGRNIGKDTLLGMPSGYVDAEKGGLLTNALGKNPRGIFLFDEMEKAGSGVYDLFLNCLDKGWINDARGKRYDCSRATFIFTTNVGRDVDPDLAEAKIRDKMVRAGFRPELMGRINKAIVFRPLSIEAAREIALATFNDSLKEMAVKQRLALPAVSWTPSKVAVDFFLNDLGYDTYGVRAILKACKELAGDVLKQASDQGKEKAVLYPSKHPAPKLDDNTLLMPLGVKEAIDLSALRAHVANKVKGQDAALDTVIEQLEMREMGMIAKPEQPEGTFLFTGPSGTGKTELVKQVADYLGRKFIIFNMGNFKGENGVEAFFGPPPGYAGSEKGGQLTQAILDNPDAIILLDEIEKANPKIWDAFMGVFDDGFAKDTSTGAEVAFAKTMIFMTSNIVTEYAEEDVLRDVLRHSNYFRPEMVNRIEHIVSFKPLGEAVKDDVVRKVIQGVLDNYNRANGTALAVKDEWVTRFAAEANFANGVRDIQRKIQKELMKEMKGLDVV